MAGFPYGKFGRARIGVETFDTWRDGDADPGRGMDPSGGGGGGNAGIGGADDEVRLNLVPVESVDCGSADTDRDIGGGAGLPAESGRELVRDGNGRLIAELCTEEVFEATVETGPVAVPGDGSRSGIISGNGSIMDSEGTAAIVGLPIRRLSSGMGGGTSLEV